MKHQVWRWALALSLVLLPRPAVAQCGGGSSGGGGHEHEEAAPQRRDSKTERAIQRLMEDEKSRGTILEAILADPPFMRDMIGAIAEIPEWRALAAERLGLQAPAASPAPHEAHRVQEAAPVTKEEQAVFTCPMHPEVTSIRPGTCPKCGMTLRRSP